MKALLLLTLVACNPYLMAESAAPPGRSARLDEVRGFWDSVKSYRLELSAGVAVAISCSKQGPCEHVVATSDDPAIAEVRPASLGVLEHSGWANQATTAALVVVGKAPGTTKLHVRAAEGQRDIAVTIVPAPSATTRTAVN